VKEAAVGERGRVGVNADCRGGGLLGTEKSGKWVTRKGGGDEGGWEEGEFEGRRGY